MIVDLEKSSPFLSPNRNAGISSSLLAKVVNAVNNLVLPSVY